LEGCVYHIIIIIIIIIISVLRMLLALVKKVLILDSSIWQDPLGYTLSDRASGEGVLDAYLV
jgi:hypothetical protein